jgi:hypothetical protein
LQKYRAERGLKSRPKNLLGSETMSGDEYTLLDKITEFERTFEQNYGRNMTIEERCIIEAAKQIIQQTWTEYSEKLG